MLSGVLGWTLYRLTLPSKKKACMEDFFAGQAAPGPVSRLLRREIVRRYRSLDDAQKRRLNRERFWGTKPGIVWHELKKREYSNPERFQEEFLRFRKTLTDQIAELLSVSTEFKTLCHIGTGHGLFIEYLSRRLPQIENFVGLDICREQIEENQKNYRGSSLRFEHAEVLDWMRAQPRSGIIFVTVGTFQYFTPAELEEFLLAVREGGRPAVVALSEPVNIALTSAVRSEFRGDIGYSHPYPYLFQKFNYQLFQSALVPVDPRIACYNEVILVAANSPVGRTLAEEWK